MKQTRTRNEKSETKNRVIRAHYAVLEQKYGPQHWWPARTRLEVIIGALLTQNTSWTNVERAIANLRRARALNLSAIRALPESELAELIRSSGYFRQKARRIKNFISYLDREHSGSISRLFRSRNHDDVHDLRQQLLTLNGIGPETADAILLYAGNYPVFVVDAYTKRLFARHRLFPENAPYDEIRVAVESSFIKHSHQPPAALTLTPASRSLPPATRSLPPRRPSQRIPRPHRSCRKRALPQIKSRLPLVSFAAPFAEARSRYIFCLTITEIKAKMGRIETYRAARTLSPVFSGF